MSRFLSFRRSLIISSIVMLSGIGVLAVSLSGTGNVPNAWTKVGALFVTCGAAAELFAVWRFNRQR